MCLSTVFNTNPENADTPLAEYVTNLEIAGGEIRLIDITGAELTLRGALRNIDLIAGRIFIDPEN